MEQGLTFSPDDRRIQQLCEQLLKLCKDGCTAKVGVFKSLLDQGADPNIHDEYGHHPLWYASRYGKIDLVELFLQYKADINLKTTSILRRETALHAACEHGHKDVASLLLHHGAVVDSQDMHGRTALHLASSGAHTDVVKLLVDSGALIDNKDIDGWTALDLASKKDHTVVIKVLLASGAHHGMKYLGQQLLKLCTDGCTAEVGVFKSLLDQGVDPNIQNEYGLHPLWYASRYGKRDLVELFLQYKADVNLKAEDGQTALHLASNSGHTDVVKLLVVSGAQIDNKDKDGWTALDLASNKHHTDVVKVLYASGAHHGIKYLRQQLLKLCKDGCTAEVGVFTSLLDQGADPNIQDEYDYHPLWYASCYGKRDLVELFLQYKADVNLKTNVRHITTLIHVHTQ